MRVTIYEQVHGNTLMPVMEKLSLARGRHLNSLYLRREVKTIKRYEINGRQGELDELTFVWLSGGWYSPELGAHLLSVNVRRETLTIETANRATAPAVVYLEMANEREYYMYEVPVREVRVDTVNVKGLTILMLEGDQGNRLLNDLRLSSCYFEDAVDIGLTFNLLTYNDSVQDLSLQAVLQNYQPQEVVEYPVFPDQRSNEQEGG